MPAKNSRGIKNKWCPIGCGKSMEYHIYTHKYQCQKCGETMSKRQLEEANASTKEDS